LVELCAGGGGEGDGFGVAVAAAGAVALDEFEVFEADEGVEEFAEEEAGFLGEGGEGGDFPAVKEEENF
jgi:hypothetical protein